MQRRSVLKLAGATVGLGALSAAPIAQARPDNVIDLGNEGLQPGDDLSPYLDEYWQSGNEVHIPGGEYELSDVDSLEIDADEDSWLIGDGDVIADHGDVHVLFNITSNGDAHVRMQNITLKGIDSTEDGDIGKVRVWAEDEEGLVELINFNRPDGADGGSRASGFFMPKPHAGVGRFINCHVEGFTDNGLYGTPFAGGDSDDGMGTVEVYGGLYKNNDVNNIRVGCDDSKVISAAVVFDDVPYGQETGSHKGIRVRQGGANQVIHDCDITVYDEPGAAAGIKIDDSRFENGLDSDVTVTDTRIYNEIDAGAVQTSDEDFPISGENIHLTGPGDLDLQGSGPYSDVYRGSEADSPTEQKRWVDGWGDAPDGSTSDSGSTDSSTLAVSTMEPSSVGSTTATLTGSLDSLGGATGASVYFEHRATGTDDWRSTSPETVEETGTFEATVDLLESGTEYEYRAIAETVDGNATGSAVSFNTSYNHYLEVQTFDNSGIVYDFTVDGSVVKADHAGNNDTITDNGDGTYSVEGETGNGFYDDYYFNGQVTAFSAETHPEADNGDYELRLDGDVVTVDELTGQSDSTDSTDSTDDTTDSTDSTDETSDSTGSGTNPTISTFDVSEAGSPNPHLDVTSVWEVADADGDLSWVLVQVVNSSGLVVDAAKTSISGDSAADVNYFKVKNVDGQSFSVKLTVSDAAGNTTTVTKSVSE
ncbi:fibronectin type III domain-containing protein [Halorarius litoreus]|uniref:fibronectin type III domain-containing protein n=1 Tax=Halorarius litoreus TaxID=2962676 RepID=UPI0020CE35CA|nr:fibronectin type III domain-containing protein [Halorarius litoreus]